MTIVKLQKWGNSQGIRISKETLENIGITDLDNVQFELSVINKTITLTPKIELTPYERLFIGYDFNKTRAQFEWDENVGNEYW